MSTEEQSIAQCFMQAQFLYRSIDLIASTDPSYKSTINKAIESLRNVQSLVATQSIFSDNEIVDDIHTVDLQLVLSFVYLGIVMLMQSFPTDTSSTELDRIRYRISLLNDAKKQFDTYLQYIENFGLFNDTQPDTASSPAVSIMQQRRDAKIQKYKREKDIKARIKDLEVICFGKPVPDHISNLLSTNTDNKLSNKVWKLKEDVDEDVHRSLVLCMIDYYNGQATEHLESIREELSLLSDRLSSISRQQSNPNKENERKEQDSTWKLDKMAKNLPLLSSSGKPLRPFVLTSKRDEIAKSVFRPGHNLPTMSIDEYLHREMERGNFLQGGANSDEATKKKVIDDANEIAIDLETYKARQWDDFKDDNPKGWGNRGGNIG